MSPGILTKVPDAAKNSSLKPETVVISVPEIIVTPSTPINASETVSVFGADVNGDGRNDAIVASSD